MSPLPPPGRTGQALDKPGSLVYTLDILRLMVTKVRKWGNSLGVRLPKSAAEEVRVSDGSPVDVRVRNGEIIVRPMRKARFRLRELLAAVRPGNIHSEIDAGAARGRELL